MRTLLVLVCVMSVAASAADSGDSSATPELRVPDPARWSFEVEPYLWFPAMNADADFGVVHEDTDADLGDVFDVWQGGATLRGAAQKGRWGIDGEFIWMRLADDEGGLGPANDGDMDVELTLTMFELAGMYRFEVDKFSIAPIVGVRAAWISTDIEITDADGGDGTAEGRPGWIEPMVGANISYQATPKFSVSARADTSGSGAGSDVTWNAEGSMRYQFNDLIALTGGYRYLFIDYNHDNADVELTLHGPTIGIAFTF